MKTVLLIAPEFYPSRSSAAIQLLDLSIEISSLGFYVVIIAPEISQRVKIATKKFHNVKVIRIKTLNTKSSLYFFRAVAEFISPYLMLVKLRKFSNIPKSCTGIIWYSPSIFLTPLVKHFKKKYECQTYLILRDIFPKWAFDLGLIKSKAIYFSLKFFENRQYKFADVVGVQSERSLEYFTLDNPLSHTKLTVLENWLSKKYTEEAISSANFLINFRGRRIFVYAGNMGIAQGLDIFIEAIKNISSRSDIAFLFVGKGSDVQKLKNLSTNLKIKNIIFVNEISSNQINWLYKKCHFGIICLDKRHKTQNIPGKFISYLRAGLPVVAFVNRGNDLEQIITSTNVGFVTEDFSQKSIETLLTSCLSYQDYAGLKINCKKLFKTRYAATRAAKNILATFE